jgi:hypothetical protein
MGGVYSVLQKWTAAAATNDTKLEMIGSLQRQLAVLRREQATHLSELESAREEATNLRNTAALLRCKINSQGQRETDYLRRTAMYSKLEPIFDKLGELFNYKSPMEIVERLEFLEGSQLGAHERLADVQEELQKALRQLKLERFQREAERVGTDAAHAEVLTAMRGGKESLMAELAAAQEQV